MLRELGVKLVPIKLPDKYPVCGRLRCILGAEAAAAFDDLTRKGVTEGLDTWPATFRQGAVRPGGRVPPGQPHPHAADAGDGRGDGDRWTSTSAATTSLITNLTGHPTVVLPERLPQGQGDVETPTAITFTGRLYGETELLAVAHAYQQATGHHLRGRRWRS